MKKSTFKLKSQGAPYKMLGSSPVKQINKYKKKGIDISNLGGVMEHDVKFGGGDTPTTTTSFTPKIKLGWDKKFSLGAKLSGQSTGIGPGVVTPVSPFKPQHTETSVTAKYDFSGDGGRHGEHPTFQGSIGGNVGIRDIFHMKAPERGKLTLGGKVEGGFGTKTKNIKAFGEYGSKYSLSGKGPKVGITGQYGIIKGGIGYNVKTKKPEFKVGINI